MRVLLVNGRLSDRGGSDRWFLGVAAREPGAVVAVERVEIDDPRIGEVHTARGLDRRGLRPRGEAAAVAALRRLVDAVAPDVIHANNIVDPALLDVIAGSGRGVLTVQDHRSFCPGNGKVKPDGVPCSSPMGEACATCVGDPSYLERILSLTRRRAEAASRMAAVTVLSRYMARELDVVGVHGAVPIPPFPDGLPEVERGPARWHLFAGRLAAHKGVAMALAARDLLREPLPLVVLGEGPEAPAHARWAGREDLARAMAGAASVWVPSAWAEPFGIVGIEAMSLGIPVIATRVGGIPEWAGEGTFLVEPGDARSLARRADALARDPALRVSVGDAGRRAARAFEPEPLMERLRQVWRRVPS